MANRRARTWLVLRPVEPGVFRVVGQQPAPSAHEALARAPGRFVVGVGEFVVAAWSNATCACGSPKDPDSASCRACWISEPADRFLEKVVPGEGGCWLWTGAIPRNGYGTFYDGERLVRAHRFSYEAFVGPIPPGFVIDHLCRVRSCVNPKHLEAVTQAENLRRGKSANALKTHCPRGHPYDEENTRVMGGWRWCRACQREVDRKRTRHAAA